ncbi:hypothetical protein T265_07703 [Opisthorchis viverrini]|uniref:Uncharacterized protein n=1 Tax=Opisthorchis viverrini TaxID=6198 RepID=A0A074ZBQ0_OPIVI|nr:hypothetical protein T265_07703 [Opisthorchis viverrini]KER24706.1 hypothetical protein T265_07703 [Opisthorchis viverrini]
MTIYGCPTRGYSTTTTVENDFVQDIRLINEGLSRCSLLSTFVAGRKEAGFLQPRHIPKPALRV